MAVEKSMASSSLVEVVDRILDKGIVIAGDIKVKIVDIELLTIQIRLVICSVDKAKEIGIDWWADNPAFSSRHQQALLPEADSMAKFAERLTRLEASVAVPAGGAKAS